MLRIDPTQKLVLVKPEADSVISLARTGFPFRFLASKNHCQPVKIGDCIPIDRLIESKQACLMSEQLPNSNCFLILLGELRPILTHAFIIIEPTPRMSDRQRHSGQSFSC